MATTPYGGLLFDEETHRNYAPRTGHHILVSGPSGAGKTQSVIVPALWTHLSGPRICVSSKADVIELFLQAAAGSVSVIDLRQMPDTDTGGPRDTTDQSDGHELQYLRIDPTVLIETVSDALNMAGWLYKASTLALGGQVSAKEDPFWTYQIQPCLAAILYAAAKINERIGWVLDCSMNPEIFSAEEDKKKSQKIDATEQEATPAGVKKDDEEAADRCWGRVLHELDKIIAASPEADKAAIRRLALTLSATANMEARQRDSVAMGIRGCLFPWLYPTVLNNHTPFTAEAFEYEDCPPCLFILAEPSGGGVSAALPLIQYIINYFRRKASIGEAEGETQRNLLLCIDEFTNTMPINSLDILVSEARGLGVNLLCCVQDTAQIELRYGKAMLDVLRRVFPAILLLYGSGEAEILDFASTWSGITTRAVETYDQKTGDRSYVYQQQNEMIPIELQVRTQYRGRLILKGTPGFEVFFPAFEEFKKMLGEQNVPGLAR